jgi:Tfp pilus assembly protein PilF
MGVTINQAVIARKESSLKEEERIYRAIMQSQPDYAGANNNLGVLAVSLDKPEYSLKYFRAALKADSKIEQYCLNYIDALLKVRRFESAKLVVEEARREGVAGEKLNNLEKRLSLSVQPNEPKPVVQAKSLLFQKKGSRL